MKKKKGKKIRRETKDNTSVSQVWEKIIWRSESVREKYDERRVKEKNWIYTEMDTRTDSADSILRLFIGYLLISYF